MLQVILMYIWNRPEDWHENHSYTYVLQVCDRRGVKWKGQGSGEIFSPMRQATVMIKSVLEPHCLVSSPTQLSEFCARTTLHLSFLTYKMGIIIMPALQESSEVKQGDSR